MARRFSFRLLAINWSHVLQKYAFFIMQDYLTSIWGLSVIHAAGILNIWEGIQRILPVFLLYLADELIGNTATVVFASLANCFGVACIAMSTPPILNVTRTCKLYESECIGHTQEVLFYVGMTLIAVGQAGRKVITMRPKDNNINGDGDEQGSFSGKFIALVLMLIPRGLAIGLPNIKIWPIRFGVPAFCTVVATYFFLRGLSSFEPKKERTGTNHVQDDRKPGEFIGTRTPQNLEEARIYAPQSQECTNRLKRGSKFKAALRLLPLWLPCAICAIVISNGNTYFVEQATHLRSPPYLTVAMILLYVELNTIVSKALHDHWASKFQKRLATNMVSGMTDIRLTATAKISIISVMISSVLCCITAAKIERRRLNVVITHNLVDSPNADIPMSVFWLLFQYTLLGVVDATLEIEVRELFEDEVPSLTRKYAGLFARAVLGFGYILSVLVVYIVGQISPNWFQPTLNKSRLDKYYWVLAGLTAVNLVVYSLLVCVPLCKKIVGELLEADA